jgi:DNA (cytosine-5)-methyltransferase 1
MKALSLFSGIGGLDLAAEAAGIKTTAFCEIEQYAVKVLERRWPGVPIIDDVRKIKGCDWAVDVIHGGFPCQDLSQAGKQAGLEGERSGLWFEMLRVISEIRPAFVVAENVRGAVNLALDTVQAGMEAEGYAVRTLLLPAAAFGAPHKRERMFVFGIRKDVADAYAERLQGRQEPGSIYAMWKKFSEERMEWKRERGMPISINDQVAEVERGALWPTPSANEDACGTPNGKMQKMLGNNPEVRKEGGSLNPAWVEILMGFPLGWTDVDCDEPEPWPGWPALMGESQYPYEPPRTVTGCPNRAKRLKCLGNAVVPAQARPIFEAIRQIHNFITPNVSRETLLNKIREA